MTPVDKLWVRFAVTIILLLGVFVLLGCTPATYDTYEYFSAIGKTFTVEGGPWDAPKYIRIDWSGKVLAGDYTWDLNNVYGEYTAWNNQVVIGNETYKLEEDLTADWCQFGYCN